KAAVQKVAPADGRIEAERAPLDIIDRPFQHPSFYKTTSSASMTGYKRSLLMVLGVSLRNISTSPFLATTHSFSWNSSAVAVRSPPYWIVQSQSPRFQRSVWSNFMRQ